MFKVNEIYPTILGESVYSGYPFIIVRFTGCPLRCKWCDTKYAYYQGEDFRLGPLVDKLSKFKCPNVLLTGGEPLIQTDIHKLAEKLIFRKFKVVVETSGAFSIQNIDKNVHIVLDYKLPSSGMENEMILEKNLNFLKSSDEIKFVVANKMDFNRADQIITEHQLIEKFRISVSPVINTIDLATLADLILSSNKNIRLNLQLHKIIWPEINRGR